MARLIDADKAVEYMNQVETDCPFDDKEDILEKCVNILGLCPTVDAVPVSVIKHAISGLSAAIQCDQGGRYEYELRDALKTVLKWYGSPNYLEHEKRC